MQKPSFGVVFMAIASVGFAPRLMAAAPLWEGLPAKILIAPDASAAEKDAAAELQKYLRRMSGKTLAIVTSGTSDVISIGATGVAQEARALAQKNRLADESYLIAVRPKQRRVLLWGATPAATKYAAYDFLARYGGVRWYMPTSLFEHVPSRSKLRLNEATHIEKPAFAARTFGYLGQPNISSGDEKDPQFSVDRWIARNRLSVDGRVLPANHSHNLYNVIVPSRDGKTHPEWFPLINGQRFIPPTDDHQNWQPELTNPQVVEKFIEAGRQFFHANPDPNRWFSLGINDGDNWSDSAEAVAARGTPRIYRHRVVQSELYYDFVAKVARVLKAEFPNRQIGVIAYYAVEEPPKTLGRLPDNVNVVITQETSSQHNADYKAQDVELTRRWLEVAPGHVYRYDYQGMGWFVPRYFPQLIEDDARLMKKMGLRGYYTEDVPTWQTMGPLLYVTARQWWNANNSAKAAQDEFCRDLFGLAAPAMREYFRVLEAIWMRPRPGVFFEGLGNPLAQAALYKEADIARIDGIFQRAMLQAQKSKSPRLYARRLAFFRDGWKLGSYYTREHNLYQSLARRRGTDRIEASLRLLNLLDEHEAFYKNFKNRDAFEKATLVWLIDELGRDGNWIHRARQMVSADLENALLSVSGGEAANLKTLLARYASRAHSDSTRAIFRTLQQWNDAPKSANLLRNPNLQPATKPVGTSAIEGAPPEWEFWKNSTGQPSYFSLPDATYAMRIAEADSAAFLQTHEVRSGDLLQLSARVRGSEKFDGKLLFRLRWQDAAGNWFPDSGGALDAVIEAPVTPQWEEILLLGRVPDGAARVLVLMGGERLGKNQWIEFSRPTMMSALKNKAATP